MVEHARNYEQPHERTTRLHQLAVPEEVPLQVVLQGLAERQACTAYHTPAAPGTRQWEEMHVAFRMRLAPFDWAHTDAGNYSRVLSPDRSVAITVATGDHNTGLVKDDDLYGRVEPRTKYKKGRQTRVAVEANGQISMLSGDNQPAPLTDTPARQQTWIFLVATTDDEVRYELSRPRSQDEKGYVVSWWERIIFPPVAIETVTTRIDDDDDGDEPVEVTVERI